MALFHTLKPLLSSAAIALFVILAMTNKAYSQSDSTSFTYFFYGSQPTSLTYQGDAFFPPDSTFLRLTKTDASGVPQTSTIGRALYTKPILFRAQGAVASFETTINFQITSRSGDNNPADGLVFFIAPVGSTIPSGGGGSNFGVYNASGLAPNMFAVEFDVYVNSEWDPNFRHIGINLGSRTSSNVTSFEGTNGQRVSARINYEAATRVITVYATAAAGNFEVSLVSDLGALLPEQVQVGLAASSGLHVAVHDVVSWYFSSTLVR
ncbi:lectin CPL-like [Salvia hispanica]|uniref:lectin CPL-like n=1 Tax=Salvia hispanica TaxID=49212 RepID=UPI00200978BF|nr:lectin CPL-like [Salvia hispanica]